MHAFLKKNQHFPNSHLLAQALKPMFRMLVNSIIIPKIVLVMDEKYGEILPIRYVDLILASSEKRLIQKTCDSFVAPYRGKAVENKLFTLTRGPDSWLANFMTETLYENIPINSLLINEISQIINEAVNGNGFIDTTNKKLIQLSQKFLKIYLEKD